MSGIKRSDCQFYVNEEKRTVVCVIPNTKDALLDFISDNFRFKNVDFYEAVFWNDNYSRSVLTLPDSFVGKAVCAADDEWDEELGKVIAFQRARTKFYTSFFKRANALAQAIDCRLGDMIEEFNAFGMRVQDNQDALQDYIDKALDK